MTTEFIVFATGIFLTLLWVVESFLLKLKVDRIKDREMKVGQRECLCDRRAEILATAEDAFEQRRDRYVLKSGADMRRPSARYVVTDSDIMKYNSDNAIRNVARKTLAGVIAGDIIKAFPEPISGAENGRQTYEYRFKVVEDK